MDKSLWESLLDDINKLKEKDPPSADDAPRVQSLLRQVAELTGTGRAATSVAANPIGDVVAGSSGSRALTGGQGGDRLAGVGDATAVQGKKDAADAPLVFDAEDLLNGSAYTGGFTPQDAGKITDGGLATAQRIVGKGEEKTAEDRAALAQLGGDLLGLSKSSPEAFKKLDPKLQEFTGVFGRKWRDRQNRLAVLPSKDVTYLTPDKVKIGREAWGREMGEAATSAADEVFLMPANRKALLKGIADVPAYLGKGVGLFGGSEAVNEAAEKYGKVVEAYLGRSEEFKSLKPLDRAEAVGNIIGIFLASRVAAAGLGALGAGGMITEGAAMGVTGLAAGGQVAHDLEKEGISGDRAKAAGIAATAGNIILPIVVAKAIKGLAPQSVQQPMAWIARGKVGSSAIGRVVNEVVKAVTKDEDHASAEPEDSRVEGLRKRLIDGCQPAAPSLARLRYGFGRSDFTHFSAMSGSIFSMAARSAAAPAVSPFIRFTWRRPHKAPASFGARRMPASQSSIARSYCPIAARAPQRPRMASGSSGRSRTASSKSRSAPR